MFQVKILSKNSNITNKEVLRLNFFEKWNLIKAFPRAFHSFFFISNYIHCTAFLLLIKMCLFFILYCLFPIEHGVFITICIISCVKYLTLSIQKFSSSLNKSSGNFSRYSEPWAVLFNLDKGTNSFFYCSQKVGKLILLSKKMLTLKGKKLKWGRLVPRNHKLRLENWKPQKVSARNT